MKVLIVCTGNFGYVKPFISEQVDALRKEGVELEYFLIKGKGFLGYLKNLAPLKKKIRYNNFDIVHAHSGLSGLLASLQKLKPTIITFHGGEQFQWQSNILSSIAVWLAKECIYVSESTYKDIFLKISSKDKIIPCGVNTNLFMPLKEIGACPKNFDPAKKNILFASDFTKEKLYKNPELAKRAIMQIPESNLIELRNYTRKEVNVLLNICDVLLLTSKIEGSPQIVKEAMACNCPVVATDVGDIKELFDDVEGYFLTSFQVEDVVSKIKKAIHFGRRTNARKRILKHYDNQIIAKRIIQVYKDVMMQNNK